MIRPRFTWSIGRWFKLHQEDHGLWAQMLAKYLKDCDILSANDNHASCTFSAWRGILYGAQIIRHGTKWRVGSGDNVRFWTDNWLSCGPLNQYAAIKG